MARKLVVEVGTVGVEEVRVWREVADVRGEEVATEYAARRSTDAEPA